MTGVDGCYPLDCYDYWSICAAKEIIAKPQIALFHYWKHYKPLIIGNNARNMTRTIEINIARLSAIGIDMAHTSASLEHSSHLYRRILFHCNH